MSHIVKKTERGHFGIIQHLFCRKTPKALKGGPFGGKNIFEKCRTVPKKLKGGTL